MAVITKKGQVTLPKLLREKIGIKEGDEVAFELEKDAMKIKRVEKKSLLKLGGIAKGRAMGRGDERIYAKEKISDKIAKEGIHGE